MTKLNLNDPIALHMHRHITRLRAEQSVESARKLLRDHPPAGRILYLYVVDDEERLVGVVPTRRFLLANPETPVGELMVRKLVKIPLDATVQDACEFFILHRFLALPVVDPAGRLVGVVDVELYLDEETRLDDEARADDLFQLVGVHAAGLHSDSPLTAVRSRFPWLLCNIGGGLLAAFLTGLFEAELQKVVALALFIPVVLALAESVAIQSVSLTLERLHHGGSSRSGLLGKVRRELVTGLGLGLLAGGVVALAELVWLGQSQVALCLLGGIAGGVTVAATLGMATPLLLRLWTPNPRVAAGPIALAGADMATLLIYFGLARLLLG
ncbi:MAG: CBS domain-containing protein [Gemmataceae bacterium]